MFYFPPQEDDDDEEKSSNTVEMGPTQVIYSHAPGTTFTSPSIYVSFDYVTATYQGYESYVKGVWCGDYGQGWSPKGSNVSNRDAPYRSTTTVLPNQIYGTFRWVAYR